MRDIIRETIEAATREIDVCESPKGSNWGPRVGDYIRAGGYNSPVYWCACFGYFCVRAACAGLELPNPLPRTGSCDIWLYWARRQGVLKPQPQPGDLFLVMASADDAVHTGLVTAVHEDGTVSTIEGNSNDGGSRNGYKVASRKRKTRGLLFVRWADLVPERKGKLTSFAPEPPTWAVTLDGEALGEAWIAPEGVAYWPARAFLSRVMTPAAVTASLAYDTENEYLTWDGKPIPAPVTLREGSAWAQLRRLAVWAGLQVEVDAPGRTIRLKRQTPGVTK